MKIHVARSIGEIPREEWNSLVSREDLPFLEWDWLAALEESGSIAPETGWFPLHLTLRNSAGGLLAAAPLYLKTHSMGEFVFDHIWAEAAQSLGRPYYPKLVGVVPATPAEGYRFLHRPGEDREELDRILFDAAEAVCRANGIVGLHILFADPRWAGPARRDYPRWVHHHYLWENPGFSGFTDYLAVFSKNQRKNIRKEAGRAEEQGIAVRAVPGREAPEDFFPRMFELYSRTNDKFVPWDARFVNEEFFRILGRGFRERLAFVEARRPGEGPLALAMLVRKGDRLWGRYWGADQDIRDLHFQTCYYTPIRWAIDQGIRSFDPGAGSPHKIRRGFRAVENHSFHRFFDPVLARLFADNIDMVNRHERAVIDELNDGLPLKEPPPSPEPP